MQTYEALFIYCDGGARGNPGPAAIGVVIKNQTGAVMYEVSKRIGFATNNVAEYQAVLEALKFLFHKGLVAKVLIFCLDSKVVAQQLSGVYKVKQAHLQELFRRVKQSEAPVAKSVFYRYIPREKNSHADRLLNQTLDSKDQGLSNTAASEAKI